MAVDLLVDIADIIAEPVSGSVSIRPAGGQVLRRADGQAVAPVHAAAELGTGGSPTSALFPGVPTSDDTLLDADSRGYVLEVAVTMRRAPRARGDVERTTVKRLVSVAGTGTVNWLDLEDAQPVTPTGYTTLSALVAAFEASIAPLAADADAAQAAAEAAQTAAQQAQADTAAALAILAAGDPERTEQNLAALQLQTGAKVFAAPPGFTFPIPVTPTRDEVGRYSVPDVDIESLHVRGTGPTYYVDPINGSNTNTGLSWAQAFATPYYATRKNDGDAAEIICKGGIYLRGNSPVRQQANVILRSAPGERAIFTACDVVADTAWTLTAGATWQTPMSVVAGVLDNLNQDAEGDPTRLPSAATLAECESKPGTWFAASGVLHVHLADDRKPDAQTLVSRALSAYGGTPPAVASSYLFDRIEWWGGTGVNMTPQAAGSQFLAKGSAFKFATTNGLSAWGLGLVVLEDCTAAKNTRDGFNYTVHSGWEVSALEINCVGYRNGFQNTGSQNGTTSHNAAKVIRVGGTHRANQGANVADVNSARSWNVGVQATQSLDYGQDFYGQEMWLDACRSGSRIAIAGDFTVNPAPRVYHRATVLAGSIDTAGQTW